MSFQSEISVLLLINEAMGGQIKTKPKPLVYTPVPQCSGDLH